MAKQLSMFTNTLVFLPS